MSLMELPQMEALKTRFCQFSEQSSLTAHELGTSQKLHRSSPVLSYGVPVA